MENRKNNCCMIDIYRCLFTIGVCLMHFESAYFNSERRVFEGCYLAVEFFFVLSGYLLCKAVKSGKYENANTYTGARIRELIPYNILMIACFFSWNVWQIVITENGFIRILLDIVNKGLYAFYELIFLQMFLPSEMLNGPIWYVSVLITAGYAYYYYLDKRERCGGYFSL